VAVAVVQGALVRKALQIKEAMAESELCGALLARLSTTAVAVVVEITGSRLLMVLMAMLVQADKVAVVPGMLKPAQKLLVVLLIQVAVAAVLETLIMHRVRVVTAGRESSSFDMRCPRFRCQISTPAVRPTTLDLRRLTI
jgi:hypothetical protein